jgi:hypothetical protein
MTPFALRTATLAAALAATLPCGVAAAQGLPPGIVTKPLPFPAGRNTAIATGTIKGDRTVDHVVRLRAGQPLNVSLASKNSGLYFNILEPGETVVAIHNGSVSGTQFEGTSAKDGDYRIRVYFMRAQARRGATASYRLEVIAGTGTNGGGAGAAAPAAGRAFAATGMMPCAKVAAQPMAQCTWGVVRTGGGNGTVVVTHPDGMVRTLVFRAGKVTGYERGARDRGAFSVTRSGDLNSVRIGGERYEFPDAVMNGG